MVRTLKVFIFLLFLLSITCLVLGTMLFGQREKLKARILAHEASAVAISEKLRMENPINPVTLKNHETVRERLRPLAAEADNVNITLDDTKADLASTKQELAETKDTLESTKTQLAASQEQVNTLEEEKIALNDRIDMKQADIERLEGEKDGLAAMIEEVKSTLAMKEQEIDILNHKVTQMEEEIERLTPDDDNTVPEIPEGEGGKIVMVNTEWNYVVLDIGREIGLKPNTELMIHRGDNLVGKVKVRSLEDNMSAADVIGVYTPEPIKVGDEVIYVNL